MYVKSTQVILSFNCDLDPLTWISPHLTEKCFTCTSKTGVIGALVAPPVLAILNESIAHDSLMSLSEVFGRDLQHHARHFCHSSAGHGPRCDFAIRHFVIPALVALPACFLT